MNVLYSRKVRNKWKISFVKPDECDKNYQSKKVNKIFIPLFDILILLFISCRQLKICGVAQAFRITIWVLPKWGHLKTGHSNIAQKLIKVHHLRYFRQPPLRQYLVSYRFTSYRFGGVVILFAVSCFELLSTPQEAMLSIPQLSLQYETTTKCHATLSNFQVVCLPTI